MTITTKNNYSFPGLLLAVSLLFFTSCKETQDTVDCSTYNYSLCQTKEPFTANFHIKLTINSENPAVPITIYQGKLDDGIVFLHDTLKTESFDTLLPIGNYYTVAAQYKVGSTTVTAIDGDKISKSHVTTCDSICWSVVTGTTNVRLK